MGRNALPANVHVLNGNPSKRGKAELDAPMVRIPVEAPQAPAHLGEAARQEWQRIVPHLVTAGLVTQLDRSALAAYCQAYGEWTVLESRLKDLMASMGAHALIDTTPSGYKQVSALAQARDRALDRMLRFAKEFGLTPASRIASTAGQQMPLPGVPDDPMEAFLAAGTQLALPQSA